MQLTCNNIYCVCIKITKAANGPSYPNIILASAASNVEVRFITLEMTDLVGVDLWVLNSQNSSISLKNMTINSNGIWSNRGINSFNSTTTLQHVTINIAQSPSYCTGVFNQSSIAASALLEMNDSVINMTACGNTTRSIRNDWSGGTSVARVNNSVIAQSIAGISGNTTYVTNSRLISGTINFSKCINVYDDDLNPITCY